VADVALGVAVVSLVAATVFFLLPRGAPGGHADLTARF
jgi:hypothetical protein